ncbi:hypothetical protein L2E82_11651 [Cichorium intybus]|uniref:Uncharacterized protein n=1 Tax=Cichorium intybus TaxID=13427 RepID=A0ACB9GFV3_CICIN|nr:hypothetical protein L2E82_11651 [Cichorium intybus]
MIVVNIGLSNNKFFVDALLLHRFDDCRDSFSTTQSLLQTPSFLELRVLITAWDLIELRAKEFEVSFDR